MKSKKSYREMILSWPQVSPGELLSLRGRVVHAMHQHDAGHYHDMAIDIAAGEMRDVLWRLATCGTDPRRHSGALGSPPFRGRRGRRLVKR
jgi:hypothetical protein